MEKFNLENIDYQYLHFSPKSDAKYGIGLSFWKSNINDLLFFLRFVDRCWYNKDLIDISVCSFFEIPNELWEEIKQLTNYVVYCETDMGHQDGTTAHCNGALYPLLNSPKIKASTHIDADTLFYSFQIFFGLSNMLLDSNKVILTTNSSWDYYLDTGYRKPHAFLGPDSHTVRQFGSAFILNNKKALDTGYFPLKLMGHFEYDRYTHFENLGLDLDKDAIILPRQPFEKTPADPWFLFSFDPYMGIVHSTNEITEVENEDRKIRILKASGNELWDDIPVSKLHERKHDKLYGE